MRVKVRVTAKARRELFEQTGEFAFSVSVKEPRERNEANTRVQQLIAEHFNLPVTSIRFITGMRSKNKVFEVVRPVR